MKNLQPTLIVSVIIPTRNSERTLSQCLQSVKEQTYRKTEAIVVDNYSIDKTAQIAQTSDAMFLSLNSERSAARNLAAAHAQGDFLLFVDSDMELHPEIIEECVRLCRMKGFDAVAIPERTKAVGFFAECRKLERELYDTDPNSFLMPRFFKKNPFLNVGGFDEGLTCGEDFELARRFERSRYRIGMATLPIVHLEEGLSLRRAVLKAYHYGNSIIPFFSKGHHSALKGYCPTRFVRNIKKLLKQPAYLAGIAVLKFFEYMAYLTGVFAAILRGTTS